jgi:hypothetical protein
MEISVYGDVRTGCCYRQPPPFCPALKWLHQFGLALPKSGSTIAGRSIGRVVSQFILLITAVIAFLLTANSLVAAGRENMPSSIQLEEYWAQVPKTILQLQPFRQTSTLDFETADGRGGSVSLINLNPFVGVWYIMRITLSGEKAENNYHLETPLTYQQKIRLDDDFPHGLIVPGRNLPDVCGIRPDEALSVFSQARRSQMIYAPICQQNLFLRNPTKGHRTAIEAVTDFLRDKIPGGERIVGFVRDTFFKDAYRKQARAQNMTDPVADSRLQGGPAAASINPVYRNKLIIPPDLGMNLEDSAAAGLVPGRWYPVMEIPGIYFSVIQPDAIAPRILKSYPARVRNLDNVETSALAYLVAFDLQLFELGFAMGTEHPRVGWSRRSQKRIRDPKLPGPDGIGDIAPLVATGSVNPLNVMKTVATFTGGFKRAHGAFKYGPLALENHGSHYGFIENGVVFSKLQPGSATLFVRNDGTVDMKTWTDSSLNHLTWIKHARQNGVPIVEFDAKTGASLPGPLVARWGLGNWSGSKDNKLRTLRSGAALQHHKGKRFLIYAYFSTATPSAMARIFQAYGCRYAMHLDMNALEHTYMTVYRRRGQELMIQHLIKGMSVLDKTYGGQYIPRFLGYPDNRDFFYVMRREN